MKKIFSQLALSVIAFTYIWAVNDYRMSIDGELPVSGLLLIVAGLIMAVIFFILGMRKGSE